MLLGEVATRKNINKETQKRSNVEEKVRNPALGDENTLTFKYSMTHADTRLCLVTWMGHETLKWIVATNDRKIFCSSPIGLWPFSAFGGEPTGKSDISFWLLGQPKPKAREIS